MADEYYALNYTIYSTTSISLNISYSYYHPINNNMLSVTRVCEQSALSMLGMHLVHSNRRGGAIYTMITIKTTLRATKVSWSAVYTLLTHKNSPIVT